MVMPCESGNSTPFNKLQTLSIGSRDDKATELTTFDVRNFSRLDGFFGLPQPLSSKPSLRRLDFASVDILDANDIATVVASPWLANLHELHYYRYRESDRPHERTQMIDLVRALEKHTPLLGIFEWSQHDFINIDLIVPPVDFTLEALSDPHGIFPASLRQMTLDKFTVGHMHRLISRLHKAIGEVKNLGEAVSRALRHLASKLKPPKWLTLGIKTDAPRQGEQTEVFELDPEDVVFFRYAADELIKIGLKLNVERMPGSYEPYYKTLIEPGFTAPLPHSETDEEDEDREASLELEDG
ncbi:hypothetical protein EK21DRAFT_89032 [Setomelanomma holmii]|uniref:Uncharacterized protein n=1 Tax=Setomelanomma holmii TaxID=210430 RepID=A0A9P4HA58_9PLEO|nr:hypothetical protein EK21DRAFT_89032 [Setomelanomma holmii]